MPYEQRDMSGSLFKNKKKEKDTHPNTQGSALIDGVEYWVSGWTKSTKDGEPWISLAFKRKDEKPADSPNDRKMADAAVAGMDDDIPF